MALTAHKKGSSPLTRGKPATCTSWTIRSRLIPAHAGKTRGPPRAPDTAPAHPRSRGENASMKLRNVSLLGSSPLTRGKLWSRMARPPLSGLIPAHAGKTRETWPCLPSSRAHPRSRGENIKAAVSVVVEWGSSPLTRGKRFSGPNDGLYLRLIPAHAGKTRD